jgi:hypothetical protein
MNKIRLLILAFSICLLAACAPSAQAIPAAIATKQAAWTPTPTSTFTSTPTQTSTPIPTLTPRPTPVLVVLYSEDFSNDQSGWLQTNDATGKYQYSGGQYVINRSKGHLMSWANANKNFSDAVLTVDTFLVSGDPSQTGTLVNWRYVDINNFYSLQLTGNGQLFIGKRYKGEWQTLYNWASSNAIHTGQQVNKIAIAFGGGTSAIYINDQYVTSIQDSSFTTGDFGLGAFSGETSAVEVSFDNLVIYTIDSWTPPE